MITDKEQRRRNIARAVLKEAWRFHKRTILYTINLAVSLKIAWKTVRSYVRLHHSKVYGVSRKQELLWRLTKYRSEDIVLYFRRQLDNPFDFNAIQVIATVKGKGKAILGYLRQELSAILAPALDSGMEALVMLDRITGAGSKGLLGCNFSYLLI